jgi:hypothetical protein
VPWRIGKREYLALGVDELVHDLHGTVPLVLKLAQHHAVRGGEQIRSPGRFAHIGVAGQHEDVQRRVVVHRLLAAHPVIDGVRIEVELRVFQPDEFGQRRLAGNLRGDHYRPSSRSMAELVVGGTPASYR